MFSTRSEDFSPVVRSRYDEEDGKILVAAMETIFFWEKQSKIRSRKDWRVEEKPIWLPRAYLTRGDLEPARGNVHVCKLVRELTNIQIRTVTAERQ